MAAPKKPEETWPHTMKKGVLRGRTFASQAEYHDALMAVRANKPAPPKSQVRRIIDSYEKLIQAGLGRNDAIKTIEILTDI